MERVVMITEIQTVKGTVKLPCMTPIIVQIEKVKANTYNPNNVSDNNMQLLLQSILDNGFCFPIVTIYDDILDEYVIIDGFHRYLIFRDYLKADCLPIVVLEHDIAQRMAATIQFNRARGVHQVELMGDLVRALVEQGLSDEEVAKYLGMELEEVFRLKTVTGIAELFKNQVYSKSWVMMEVDENEE
jgi:ParB-like chromosome segregation protein Spo0J